jgi:putative NIF3 family GTP cyclohydrolase 1 type 2
VKHTFHCGAIRYTNPTKPIVKTIAVCGGAGSFLLKDAIRAKADVFITGDFKYHEFFDAENHLMIADIGHFESEQYTSEWLVAQMKKKFTNFAVRLTNVNTNPINYL